MGLTEVTINLDKKLGVAPRSSALSTMWQNKIEDIWR